MKTLSEQIRCVERELVMRCRVYPTRIANQRMSPQEADRETETMRAVLGTLKLCEQLARCLDEAPRYANGIVYTTRPVPPDVPEGACSIQISATLAAQIAAQLRGVP